MYDFYYWPLPFRGHPVRYLLADAGANWTDHGYEDTAALRALPVAKRPYPFLAPPLLHDTEAGIWLSQLPAIAMYLGRKLDRIADPDQTLRVVCDASDVLLEITRSHGAQMWDRPAWEGFLATRLPLWMELHEALATGSGVSFQAGYLFGAKEPGVADLTLAALWGTMVERLPPVAPILAAHAPTLAGLVARVSDRPAIAALRAEWEDRRPRYCGGQIEASLMEMVAGTR